MLLKSNNDKLYQYLTYFLVFSFLGWLFEMSYVYFTEGVIVSRGYFFIGPRLGNAVNGLNNTELSYLHIVWGLPVIEMYGIGGLVSIICLKKYRNNVLKIFIFGMVYMTLFELLGSYWCSEVLHHLYWDYSKELLNFQGRICLQSSLAWGVMCILTIQVIEPKLLSFYQTISVKKYCHVWLLLLTIYMLTCALVKYIFFHNIIAH